MKVVGKATALRDYQYVHATGTGGIVTKITKGKIYDVIDTGTKVGVCVSRKGKKVRLVPSFHKDRYSFQMGTLVKVEYSGRLMDVWVEHGKGNYNEDYLQRKALMKLKVVEAENPRVTLSELQNLLKR